MKHLCLTLALLCACTLTFAQKKKDNTIAIQTTASPEEAYKQLAALLQDKGYGLDLTDKELLSISTSPKVIKRAAIKINGYVRAEDTTTVYLKAEAGLPNARTNLSPVFYGGMKGSPMAFSWDELKAVAESFPEGKIIYKKD